MQSAGPQKEAKHGGKKGKGKKKSFDSTQFSNTKQKYRERGKERVSFVEQTHKQQGPTVVAVTEDLVVRSNEEEEGGAEETTCEQRSVGVEGEEVREEEEGEGGSEKGDEGMGEQKSEDVKEGEEVVKEGEEDVKKGKEVKKGGGEEVVKEEGVVAGGDDGLSDEEEKRVLLAEENLQQLEEAEKVEAVEL